MDENAKQLFIRNNRLKVLKILKQLRNKSLAHKNLNGFSYNLKAFSL